MRTLLLSYCAVALFAGCTDDKTDGESNPPVVGKAQFAAAIDDLSVDTRASLVDGVTTWDAGDKVGITALIDGTPYVKNVPYQFIAATSFGELSAVSDPILWNESVSGERSFFACWPYKPADDRFAELDCAQFDISVAAVQTVTDGVNDTKPVLIGAASTSAMTQQPIALRFKNLFPVFNLRFAAFTHTALAQIVIEPAPDAVCEGYLAAEGTIASTGRMTLDKSFQKLTVICVGEGLDLKEDVTIQIPIGRFAVTGGLKFTATTTDGRTFSHVAFAEEPFCSYIADETGEFLRARYIDHSMPLEVISDEIADGVIYFQDDLNWISKDARWTTTMTGGGWPTVTAAASATGKANYYTVDLIADFTSKGYVKSTNRTSVQARCEGYICLGTTSAQGALITPVLTAIGDMPTDIVVSFYGATYASETMIADGKPLTVKVTGAGTIGDGEATEAKIEIVNYYGWRKYWVIVKGATSATQLCFGQDVAKSVGRVLIDNILIGKAVKGAVAGDRSVNVAVEPTLERLDGDGDLSVDNALDQTCEFLLQSNLAWNISTDAGWLRVAPEVEYNGTGIVYKVVATVTGLNTTGKPRTAELVVAAGEQIKTIRVTQSSEMTVLADDFSWCDGDGTTGTSTSGIFDEVLTDKTSIGTGGTIFGSWSAKYLATGWTATDNQTKSPATRNGTLLVGGTTTLTGNLVSPALAKIGDGQMDVVVEFDVLEYKNAAETGKTILTVHNGGVVESYKGNYTGVSGDTFTGLNADKTVLQYYCGDYKGWANKDARWHHIEVVITGATASTQLEWSVPEPYSRFWIDNFKVTVKK